MKFYKGKFKPKNPKKYKGDPTNIIYRSLWEKKTMEWLDTNNNVIQWSSEEFCIPYRSPVDNKIHRYFPDFWMKAKQSKGNIEEFVLEVKPKAQCEAPERKKKKEKTFITEVAQYGVNQAKWASARQYCLNRGWEFRILTEDDIYGKKK
jgi:hypothetical protein